MCPSSPVHLGAASTDACVSVCGRYQAEKAAAAQQAALEAAMSGGIGERLPHDLMDRLSGGRGKGGGEEGGLDT
eukprot:COSAG01_NODE_650_length_14506_cov_24.157354_3_plen_74_part_00